MLGRVEHLDVGRHLQVAGGHVSRTALVDAHGDRLIGMDPQEHVLQIEDEVGHVLLHARKRGELVKGLVEADLGDGRAGDRGEQGPPQRVPQGVTEAGVERADRELLAVVLLLGDGLDGRSLDDEHVGPCSSDCCAVSVFGVRWAMCSVVVGLVVGRSGLGPCPTSSRAPR